MKRFSFVLALLTLVGCGEPVPDAPPGRVVVIGLDSLCWHLLDPLLADGELPHLGALVDRGRSAEMTTVEPLISPPNWTSIATGRRPEAHGVTGFFQMRPHVRVPAVWERLAAAGLKVGVYDYLVTWPPRQLPGGFMIPGWLRRDERVWPQEVLEVLGAPPSIYRVIDMGGPEMIVGAAFSEFEHKSADFNRLAEAFELDVGFVSFYGTDTVNHRFHHTWAPEAFDPPIPVEHPEHYGDALRDTIRKADEAVGTIVGTLGPDDHVVLVSDHGSKAAVSVPRFWGYDMNLFVSRSGAFDRGVTDLNGYITAVFRIEEEAPESALPPELLEREPVVEDLAAWARAVTTASGDALFDVTVVRDPAAALANGDVQDPFQLDVVANSLPAYAFVFVTAVPEVADAAWPDGTVVAGGEETAVSELIQAHDFTGDHDPTAFFLAAGPAIATGKKHGKERGRLSVLDVAPLVLYLAGQPIPDDLDGRLPKAFLDPGFLAERPPRTVPAADAPTLPRDSTIVTQEGDEDLRRRLRSLGYIR